MKEEKIFVDSLLTNYKIGGEGKTVLILHGWGGSSDSWKEVIEILENKFKVVCPDLPGFGKTDFPKFAWELKDYVKWLSQFVEKLNLNKFYLLGHSFGARIAVKFAVLFPQKIEKLILVDAAGIKPQINLKTKFVFLLAKMGNAIFSRKPFHKFQDSVSSIFYKIFRIKDYARAKGVMKETMKKILAEDLLPELSKIELETLIVWGKEDRILPLKYAFLFQKEIKNSKLKVLPKIGHSPHLECPEKLSQILIENLT